jgi:hypothetical protein
MAAASCCRFSGGRCFQQGRGVSSRVSRVVLVGAEALAATAGEILLGAVEPPTLENLALGQSLDVVDFRTFLKAFD